MTVVFGVEFGVEVETSLGGWVGGGFMKLMLISTQVEVEVELGNKLSNASKEKCLVSLVRMIKLRCGYAKH